MVSQDRDPQGYAWVEDKEHCEEYGRMLSADPTKVSQRAKKRGLSQVTTCIRHARYIDLIALQRIPFLKSLSCQAGRLAEVSLKAAASNHRLPAHHHGCWMQMGTLGAGNHYAEIQVVDEVFDPEAAHKMGIDRVGQVCIMIHSGSRGLGHQACSFASFVLLPGQSFEFFIDKFQANLDHRVPLDLMPYVSACTASLMEESIRRAAGGNRRAVVNGEGHGSGWDCDERPPAGMRAHWVA